MYIIYIQYIYVYIVVQLPNCVWLFVTAWTAVCQASLSPTISQSLPKFMSIELVMAFNHLILCCSLLLLPSIYMMQEVLLFKLKWLIAGNLNLGGRLLVAVLSLCAILPPQVIDVHSMPLQLEHVCCTHAYFCFHQLACTKYQLFPNLDLKIGFVTIVTFLTT